MRALGKGGRALRPVAKAGARTATKKTGVTPKTGVFKGKFKVQL